MKQCIRVFAGCAIVVWSINGTASAANELDSPGLDSTLTVAFSVLGQARDNIDHDLSKTIAIAYGFESYLIEARHAEYGYKFDGVPIIPCQSVPLVNCHAAVNEFAVLFGQRWERGGYRSINLLVGPSYISGDYRNRNISAPARSNSYAMLRTDHYNTMGIALETNLLITSTRHFGWGWTLVANVNNQQSFAGAYFNLYLGRLR